MRAALIIGLLISTGCVSVSQPGVWEPPPSRVGGSPSSLSVSRPLFTWNGGSDDVTKAIDASFDAHLRAESVFAHSDTPDVKLIGTIDELCQPTTVSNAPHECADIHSFGYSGMNVLLMAMTVGAWPVVAIFGVPTDWGVGSVRLTLAAVDPASKVQLMRWTSGTVEERAYAGIYYSGSPLAKSLAAAAAVLIDALRTSAPELEVRVAKIARWKEEMSIPQALEGDDPAIKSRALLELRDHPDPALLALIAKRATDDDDKVRFHAVAALRASGAPDAASRGALELLGRDPDPATQLAARDALDELYNVSLAEKVKDPALARLIVAIHDASTRRAALAELKQMGAAAQPALEALLFELDSATEDRKAFVEVIVAIGVFDERVEKALRREADNGMREAQLAVAQLEAKPKVVEVEAPPPPPPTVEVTRPLVAVFTVDAAMLKPAQRTTLTDVFSALLTGVAGYRIIPRDTIRQRLTQSKLETYRACYDESCQIELGKALAAEKVMNTKVIKQGAGCLTTATLYDLRTEATERAAVAESACTSTALTQIMRKLAEELAR